MALTETLSPSESDRPTPNPIPARVDATRATVVDDFPNQRIPASSGQRRLWFLEQMEPGSPLYNIPYLIRLEGVLHVSALEQALGKIIERHEALRTQFVAVGSEPRQLIRASWTLDFPVTDLTAISVTRPEEELRRLTTEEAKKPFDLQRDLMLRVRLYQLSATSHALMLVMHHLASDGWSMAVIYRELGAAYEALIKDEAPAWPEVPIQYSDFSEWQNEYLHGEPLERLIAFWKQQMAGAPTLLELPTDHPRPPLQSHRGECLAVRLPTELVARLRQTSARERVTLFMTLLAGFNIVLHRYSGQTDLVVGSPVAGRDAAETEQIVGFFVNTLLMRTDLSGDPTVKELLARVREVALAAFDHREMPYEKLVEELQPQRNLSFDPICQVYFALQNMPTAPLKLSGINLSIAPVYTGTAKSDLTVWAIEQENGELEITAEYALDLFTRERIERFLGHFRTVLAAMADQPEQRVSGLPLLTPPETRQLVQEWNATAVEYARDRTLPALFAEQVARTPDATALVFDEQELTYAELNARAETVAAVLRRHGAARTTRVAIFVERSLEMMIGLLGIHKSGAAYVPLDPTYPKERLAFMLQDSEAPVLLTQLSLLAKVPAHSAEVICLDDLGRTEATAANAQPVAELAGPDDLAYLLYTSGSTGNPKGVMVTHRNVVNFFAGMDRVLGATPGVWLAVTSISFDISVLELFWTLTRGCKVVLLADGAKLPGAGVGNGQENAPAAKKVLDFSLFYFASEDAAATGGRYRLLLDGARFADTHGFKAVWTPERHFHSFGGLYPNPAVVGAAIAAVTERVQIRAGSVVTPLHHPARVAEEWSVVDNLSHGRVGISVANGWHDRDFALQPENYADRRALMRQSMDTIRQLWRGEAVTFKGGRGNSVSVKIYPQPVQPELPMWVTAAGNPDTFKLAGEAGANVLTHLLGQEVDDLAKKIQLYRRAWRDTGHPGEGCVTIALHTFVGKDLEQVKAKVREPMIRYLADSADLLKGLSEAMYPGCEMKNLTTEETRGLVEFSFNRYFKLCGLLGTPETCRKTLSQLTRIGIDEVACLIDFGVDTESVLQSLEQLDGVRREFQAQTGPGSGPVANGRAAVRNVPLTEQVRRHQVTHLQCTPSFARILLATPETREALSAVQQLVVGGEALPVALARELNAALPGRVINMYGPTETTIWSTSSAVTATDSATGAVEIGRPLANQQTYILDAKRQPVPIGVPGELWIGGDGVARGYWRRDALTSERFAADPFRPENRMYRTGDLVRYREDGVIDFLGRVDHQVKLRGHRIELGEIEAALMQHSAVRQAVVVVRDELGEPELVAYVIPAGDEVPATAVLRGFLGQKLPGHMVPAVYVSLERMPLTPNGKVDRKALPAPQGNRGSTSGEAIAPAGDFERAVAAIWKDILHVDQVGVDDNFFDFGGHSLQVVQVQNRLRETLGIDVPVLKLFQFPTIRLLAKFVAEQATPGASEDSLRSRLEERARRRQGAQPIRRRGLSLETR